MTVTKPQANRSTDLATLCVDSMGDIFHDHNPDAGESDPRAEAIEWIATSIDQAMKAGRVLSQGDWVEIYYALDSKIKSATTESDAPEDEPGGIASWRDHLRRVMETIGPDGVNMNSEREHARIYNDLTLVPVLRNACELLLRRLDEPEGDTGAKNIGDVARAAITESLERESQSCPRIKVDPPACESCDGRGWVIDSPEVERCDSCELYDSDATADQAFARQMNLPSPLCGFSLDTCPSCGKDCSQGYSNIEFEAPHWIQVCDCEHCGARWHDVYARVDTVVTEKGDGTR